MRKINIDKQEVSFRDRPKAMNDLQYEVIIGARSNKRVQDVSNLISEMSWTTKKEGSPGQLDLELVKNDGVSFGEGDLVTLKVRQKPIFKGYVFVKDKNEKGEISVTCYDQLRYLKANQSYNFSGMTAGAIIKKISKDFGLKWGHIVDTGYAIPSLVVDDKECLDTITSVVQATAEATGRQYVFYDDYGNLNLQDIAALQVKYILGDDSFTEGYSYTTSIDDETYNYIKLVKPNKNQGQADVFLAKSATTISRWGLLQLFEKVDESLNAAQLQEMAKSRLAECNRPKRTLSLSCLGLAEIRAGSTVPVVIRELGDISLAQRLLAESVKHKFTPNSHTMDIDFTVLWEGDDYYGVQQRQFKEYDPSSAAADETDLKGGSATDAASGYRHPFHSGYTITADYGEKGGWKAGYHTGTDYVGSSKQVYAVASGKVHSTGYSKSYGNYVIIQHYDGYCSLYGHLSSVLVSAQESVDTNSRIGTEGATGRASGSHLHLEILRYPGQYPSDIDPEDFLNSNC
jgi:hypothetical protein